MSFMSYLAFDVNLSPRPMLQLSSDRAYFIILEIPTKKNGTSAWKSKTVEQAEKSRQLDLVIYHVFSIKTH